MIIQEILKSTLTVSQNLGSKFLWLLSLVIPKVRSYNMKNWKLPQRFWRERKRKTCMYQGKVLQHEKMGTSSVTMGGEEGERHVPKQDPI